MQAVRRVILKQNIRQWRQISSSCTVNTSVQGISPEQPLKNPPPSHIEKTYSPKLEKIVTDISQLNLLEVSELSDLLKKRLNLPDAPMMPMGAFGGPARPAAEDEEEEPKQVQTSFSVKLVKFDDKQKVALIKEIKNQMDGMNLVQAKKFVESAPAIVKADIAKDEAEKLKEILVKVGAEIDIE